MKLMQNAHAPSKERGFTLIEVMVAIVILTDRPAVVGPDDGVGDELEHAFGTHDVRFGAR